VNASIRRWLAVSASLVALLVLAAPAAAKDTRYTPFVTDFPRSTSPGQPATSTPADDFAWQSAGVLALGVGAGALIAGLVVARRYRRVAVAS
jgi:hypothetical protein